MATFTFTEDGDYRINPAPGLNGPDGLALTFTITGTNSAVLAVNTAPPGAAVSLSNIAYLNGSLVSQSAGTAITASGLAYVSAENASRGDLYLVLNWTSGSTVVDVATASLGNSGGSSGGTIPAGDVTSGTFGANSGDTGTYAFPNDVTVADDLTAADQIATTSTTTPLLTVTGGAANTVPVSIAGGAVTGANTTRTANITQTWNTSGVVDGALRVAITDTASGANSLAVNVLGGAAAATTLFTVDKDGDVTAAGATTSPTGVFATSVTTPLVTTASTLNLSATGANTLNLNTNGSTRVAISSGGTVTVASAALVTAAATTVTVGGAPGDARSVTRRTLTASAIADNVATTVVTITVPNVACAATVRITAIGALGAGGAIGAGEAMASNSYDISVVRTAGVNAVADISTAYGVNAANVAGADSCTAALTIGAVSGAVGAVNTFPVQITIVKSGGASDNHTAVLFTDTLNQNAGGVTLA